MYRNLWKIVCSEISIPFLLKVLSRKLFSFTLVLWKILRLVLLKKDLLIKKRVLNSNLNAERNNLLANKTVGLVLGLYL